MSDAKSVSFDRAAGYYDETRAIPEPVLSRLRDMLVAELPVDGVCLEMGVGTGRIALPLMSQGVRVVGLDISRQMLRKLIANSNGAALDIVQADATLMPFRDDTFEAALAVHVFHLVPNWKEAIGEVIRVVKPKGVLIAALGERSDQDWIARVTRRFFLEAGDPPWPPGARNMAVLDEHMRGLGAVVRELPVPSASRTSSINETLAHLEAGYSSACWSLDTITRRRAANAARAWAERELGDVDERRLASESSVWHAYRLAEQRKQELQ